MASGCAISPPKPGFILPKPTGLQLEAGGRLLVTSEGKVLHDLVELSKAEPAPS